MIYHDWNKKAWLAGFLLLAAILVLILGRISGCGELKPHKIVVGSEDPTPTPTVESPTPTDTPTQSPQPTEHPQPKCSDVVTFGQLQPIVALNCAGCHQGFDTYEKASSGKTAAGKPLIDEMIRRVQLDPSSPDHMPAQRPSLSDRDVKVFTDWAKDGFLKAGDCVGEQTPTEDFHDLAWTESQMLNDLLSRPTSLQRNTRWLIAVDQVNLGHPEAVQDALKAANKGANMVSVEKPDVFPLAKVAPGIWRINDITDLGIRDTEWKVIENASQLQFESFTQRGVALKNGTNSRLPWMYVQDFNDTVLRNAAVYYRLTQVPNTLQQLQKQLGVNFAGDLQNFKALLIGFNGSTLAPAANRLISRHDATNGSFWATYDTGPIVSEQQNIFRNPLLADAGGRANLKFAAGEQLYTLPNGLLGSFLAQINGNRLNNADPEVVHDFTSNPVAPIIRNAISCGRCHNGGLIGATDQVRIAIAQAQLGPQDTQLALGLFRPQAQVNDAMAKDNARFAQALGKLGLSPQEPDPVSKISDRFLGDQKAQDLAALLFLRADEFARCVNLSQVAQQQIGQVLAGGTASHDQFVQISKQIQKDCRIFEDPIQ